jgi:glycosyltransferase involved in cell wall biosynthesis
MQTAHPKVTLCVLSYNTGIYAEAAIRSAMASNYENLEVVCVDDCSTDASASSLKRLSKELGFAFHENPRNLGIPGTCNVGLSLATGKYFIVLGDDLLMPSRIRKDVGILEEYPEIGLVCSRAKIIGSDGLELETYLDWTDNRTEGLFQESPEAVWLRGSRIFTPTVTYRTQTLRDSDGWDSRYDFEDRPMFIRLAQDGVKGWHRAEVTTLYRRHEQNYSAKFRTGMLRQELDLLSNFQLSMPTWKITVKFIVEIHYWMLFMNATASEAREALVLADMDRWSWTLRSSAFKATFLGLTYIRPNRMATRDIGRYLRSGRVRGS